MRKWLVLWFIMIPALAYGANKDALSFTELSGEHLETRKMVTLADFHGQKTLLLFWRSDCPPCLHELALLPKIAKDNPTLSIVLISLQDEAHTRQHLTAMPANVHVWIAQNNGKEVLAAFGSQALPFSVSLHSDGSACHTHYGILGTDTVKEWEKLC